MSHLSYYNYDGIGKRNRERYKYSQAVCIEDRIECSGQGGWDPTTGELDKGISAQIDQAFKNVELNLRNAGGKGWEQVFRVRSYHVSIDNEAIEAMVDHFQKYMPNHGPLWTCVGVTGLAEDEMKVEIEVVAHNPK